MEVDEQDLPFRAEYAKTGRAKCKGCKNPISQDSVRLATITQSPFHDGKMSNWYHQHCFFHKQRPGSEGDFANFTNLRTADQIKIREQIAENGGGAVLPKAKGKKRSKVDSSSKSLQDFGVEYAKSSRSGCAGCELKISKDEVRIKKTLYDTEIGRQFGGQPSWHHIDCFAQLRNDLAYFAAGAELPGFKQLSKDDQALVIKALPACKVEDIPDAKKLKLEVEDEVNEKIEKQNKLFFKYRDLAKKEMAKKDVIAILEYNHQTPYEGDTEKLHGQFADLLAFGALKSCKNCKKRQFIFNRSGYLCNGDLTEWTKCANLEKEPEKTVCKIPKDMIAQYGALSKFKGKVEVRAISYVAPSAATLSKMVKKEESLGPRVKRERPPFYNLTFAIVGLEKEEETNLKQEVQKLGGKVSTKIDEKIIAIISNEDQVKKKSSKIKKAQELGIHVVPIDFVETVKNDPTDAISYITSKSICDWGTDPSVRIPPEEVKSSSSKSKSIYTKSVPKSVKITLKGGLAVDPDSALEDVAHVYKDKSGNIYNTVLGLTDIQKGKNSYYKLQILEADNKNRYWLFRSWGRIGTTIGGNKTDNCDTINEAIATFKSLYEEKSGNDFDNRKFFVKVPGRMYPIDVEYGENDTVKLNVEHKVKSKLPVQVQDIIKLIFDVDAMKKVMLEFDLDMEKMPLGKLSQKQIQNAYKVLTELNELIQSGTATNSQFIDASNRFYTLIPHDFGIDNPPILDTAEQIKHHSELLDNLIEIECAYSMLKAEDGDNVDKNPIDQHYEQLKTELIPLDKSAEEYELLKTYVQNSHAETHRSYDLEILDIFKVARKNEARRFKPFKKLHNRKLLWHGSRLTNYAGILSHGLKIAPPEAPSTGYMFGKGIYFADMVSKSGNYCCTSKQNSTGFLLLSEVALGDMFECEHANYVTSLPKNKHSTKGIGQTYPNPKESHFRKDGTEIPYGKPITDNKIGSSLLYNEYIVYDVAQVNIQYLFKMKFNYKY